VARNEVKLKVVLTDDGTLKLVTDKAKKAKKATDDLTGSTENLNRARNRYNKAEKGVAGLGANTTKNFSKMNQTLGSGSSGLVAAYATLAANAFAATAALNALSRAAAFEQLANGLALVGSQAGQNLPQVANQLKDITNGALSAEQALRATAVATTSGFSSDQLLKLTKVAKGASVALGRDLGDALDRLVRGTAKLEPEILDELGIIVRLDDATTKYAASVGKVAGDLTTFERQQAFLNATIEQGEKKYGALAERLDTNPYEKLAAAFNDLAKSITIGVNTVLGPFAEFLAQNSFALFGALTAFTFSISRALLPSLTSMSVAASEIHTRAAATAKKAGRVISSQYQKQLAEVTRLARAAKGLNALPASFQRSLPALEKGTLKAKELKTLLNNLKKAEQLRGAAIARAGNQASKAKIDEFNAVKALRMEVEALTASETKRTVANTSGAAAGGRSRTSRRTSNAIALIENAGAFDGLTIATRNAGNELKGFNRTARKNVQQLGFVRGSLVSTRLAFVSAAGAAKVFGAALLNAIPVIGQVLFVLSLIGPYLADLIGFGETDPVAEATEGFKSFSQVSIELSRSLALATSEGEKNFATMKAGAGVINQVVSAYEALKQSKIEKAYEDFDEDLTSQVSKIKLIGEQEEELAETRAKIAAKEAEARARGVDPSQIGFYQYLKDQEESRLKRLRETKGELEDLREKVSKGLGDAAIVDQAEGIKLLSQAVANLQAAPDGAENFAGELELFEQALINIQKPGADAASIIENLRSEANKRLGLTKAADNASSTMSQLNTEIAKLGKKAPTQFQTATDFIKTMSKDLKTLKEDQAQYNDFLEKTDAGKSISELMDRAGVESLEEVAKILEDNNRLISEAKDRSKEYAQTASQIGKISKSNADLTKKQIHFERQAVQTKIEGLQKEIENTNILEGGADAVEKVEALQRQILTLQNQIVDEAEEKYRIDVASINAQKRLLGFDEKRAQAMERQFSLDQRLARLQVEIQAAKTLSNVTPEDEYRLLQNAAKEREQIEEEKNRIAQERLRLEFALVDAQLLVEQKRLERIAKEMRQQADQMSVINPDEDIVRSMSGMPGVGPTIYTPEAQQRLVQAYELRQEALDLDRTAIELSEQRTRVESTGISLVASQREAAATEADIRTEESTLARIQAEYYAWEQKQALIEAEVTQLRAMGLEDQARALESANSSQYLAILQEAINERKKEGLETTELELEVIKEVTAEIEKQKERINEIADRIGRSSATAMASIASSAQVDFAADAYEKAMAPDSKATPEEQQAAKLELTKQSALALSAVTKGIAEDMRAIGPEGELMGATMEAVSNITTTFVGAFQIIGDENASMTQKVQAGLAATSALLQGYAQISKAASDARIKGIDNEIAAEKKRDGKSAASVARIKELEAKKLKEQKKAFETEKKMKIAQTVIATAQGAISAYTSLASIPIVGHALGIAAAAAVTAMGLKQVQMIQATSFQGGGSVGSGGPSSISMGNRRNSVDLARSQSARGELGYFRGESGTGGPENFKATGAFSGLKYRADGGNTAFMVGERGPELFMPNRPGTILPNDEVASSGPTNVSFNISTVDATGVEDLLVGQRGNIIGMIREAANSYGQDFVEEVDTSVFNSTTSGVARY